MVCEMKEMILKNFKNGIFLTSKIGVFCVLIYFANPAYTQGVRVVKYDFLEGLLNNNSEKVRVINFWATWCAPCIKEIPYFEEVNKNNPDAEVYLISLDAATKISKVRDFVKSKDLKSTIVLLDEIDYNSWIDKVEPTWSGAIPATLILDKNSKRKFFEGEMSREELTEYVNKFTN